MIQQCSLSSARGRWILLATFLASGTAFLTGTAVIIALPAIQSYFSTNITGLQWVVNAHLLSLSALLLIGGSLGDRFGRQRIFVLGISLFATGGVLSALATTVGLLISFQALQGAGAALMAAQTLAIINTCFAENQRGQAIGLWAGFSGGIAAAGPWLAGWLIETFSWQAVFLMTVPISISALVITVIFIPENAESGGRELDWLGTLFILSGLFGIAYGLISAPVAGWKTISVIVSLIGGVTAIILFFLVEWHQIRPLVPLRLFRNPLVTGANVVTFFLYFALNGVLLFTVFNLQQIQGYSPSITGLGLLPPMVLITVFAGPAGALADKIGPRWQMVAGPAIVAVGAASLTVGGADASYIKHFLPGLALSGIGMALVIAPLTKSALSVEPRFSGVASGVNNAIARIAALMAVAVLGAIVTSTFSARLHDTIGASDLNNADQQQILSQSDKLGGISLPENFSETDRFAAENAVKESFVYGFRWAMASCALLALIAALVSFATIHRPPRPSD